MTNSVPVSGRRETLIGRHPLAAYFALTFAVSWSGALAVAASHLMRHEPLPKMDGILMFPAMLLGPSCIGIVLTRIVDGKSGLRDLFSQMLRGRVSPRWYAAVLIPPVLVLDRSLLFQDIRLPRLCPNRFLLGVLFGVPARLLEEIGWTGYAFPKMRLQNNELAASILLGLLWSIWHLPVIDFLGTATPHGAYWFPFFVAFAVAMTAMRVLISWIYTNTGGTMAASTAICEPIAQDNTSYEDKPEVWW